VETVREFLASKDDYSELQTFTNTALAEVWEVTGDTYDWELLYKRREHYAAEVPMQGGVLTAGVDVQDDRFEYEVVQWLNGEESYSVEYGRLYGDPSRQGIWDKLAEALRRPRKTPDGTQMDVKIACIDSGGHYTDEVYRFSRKHGVRWAVPVKGSSESGKPVASFPRTPDQKHRVFLTMVGTDTAKEVIYQRYAIADPGSGYCHWPIRDAYDEEYFRQATAEQKVPETRKGITVYRWMPQKGRRNEALDCRVYAFAGIRILQQHAGLRLSDIAERASTQPTVGRIKSKPFGSAFSRRNL
jgi:phage terminase large subunit GpA-like protein